MFNLIRQRCGGLDVHQATVWACLMIVQADGSIAKTIRRFTTPGLRQGRHDQ